MVTLRTIVFCAATLGVAAAKRVCTVKPPAPTQTGSEPQPTDVPSEDFPTGGGGQGEQPAQLPNGEFKQSSHFEGEAWFTEWNHWSYPDPTNGRVNYLNVDDARAKNLSYVGSDGKKFFMRVDSTSVLDPNGPGRDAVRIHSNNPIESGISVLELTRMPAGMSQWPAYWSCGPNWPEGGEFDIIEAVNDGTNNLMSLHTGKDCTQPDKGGNRDMTGSVGYWDCHAYGAEGNRGCGVSSPDDHSIGKGFNENGGGWYATERTDTSIKVWYWSRTDTKVPDDVKYNLGFVNPSKWGTPTAAFVTDSCDLKAKFGPQTGIINTTFCGDWAGNVYPGGMEACKNFVNSNPQAFQNEFWEIDRMTVYTAQ